MAVAHESATESHTGTTGSASEASFDIASIPFTASSRGCLVFVATNANADDALTVKIAPAGANTDVPSVATIGLTSTESGFVEAFFLGTGLPSTTQTVRVNRNNNANVMYACVVTVTAGADTEVYVPGIVTQSLASSALAEQNVDDGSPGVNSLRYGFVNSGLAAPPPQGANSTNLLDIDFGARVARLCRENTAGQGSRPIGFAQATADEVCAMYLAVREVTGPPATPPQKLLIPGFAVARSYSH